MGASRGTVTLFAAGMPRPWPSNSRLHPMESKHVSCRSFQSIHPVATANRRQAAATLCRALDARMDTSRSLWRRERRTVSGSSIRRGFSAHRVCCVSADARLERVPSHAVCVGKDYSLRVAPFTLVHRWIHLPRRCRRLGVGDADPLRHLLARCRLLFQLQTEVGHGGPADNVRHASPDR